MATSYSITTDFTNASNVNLYDLQTEIAADAGVSVDPDYCTRNDDEVVVWFPSVLSGGQKTALDAVIAAYTYVLHDETTVATLCEVQPIGTNGGTFTAGSWQVRTLNTISSDVSTWCTLSSNQFTLQPGKYFISIKAPAYKVQSHQVRLYNATDSSVDGTGSSEFNYATGNNSSVTKSICDVSVKLTSAKTYRVEHQCKKTRADDGLGLGAGDGDEIFTQVTILNI